MAAPKGNQYAKGNEGGRETLYRTEYCDRVIQMGREGASKAMMADDLDVARYTLDRWAEEYQEFCDALTRARDCALAWFERRAVKEIEEPSGLNAGLYGRVMAARFPDDYRETTKHDLVSSDDSQKQQVFVYLPDNGRT